MRCVGIGSIGLRVRQHLRGAGRITQLGEAGGRLGAATAEAIAAACCGVCRCAATPVACGSCASSAWRIGVEMLKPSASSTTRSIGDRVCDVVGL